MHTTLYIFSHTGIGIGIGIGRDTDTEASTSTASACLHIACTSRSLGPVPTVHTSDVTTAVTIIEAVLYIHTPKPVYVHLHGLGMSVSRHHPLGLSHIVIPSHVAHQQRLDVLLHAGHRGFESKVLVTAQLPTRL